MSPHRTKRPWSGQVEDAPIDQLPKHDENCPLCSGNKRANGEKNPSYTDTFVFTNDFSALSQTENVEMNDDELFNFSTESGRCRVMCFSPRHDQTLSDMSVSSIEQVIRTWMDEFESASRLSNISHVQIFENKGAMMGCSNPHPHCQIWAQQHIPDEVRKKDERQRTYLERHGNTLLKDYLEKELSFNARIIHESEHFVLLVPFWAIWPYEVMLLPKRPMPNILEMSQEEVADYAYVLNALSRMYDQLFGIKFPYSAGIHQSPVNSSDVKHWHWHHSFYPPLLRSATIRKFMVGYEMFGEPQRDILAEDAAAQLKSLFKSVTHAKTSH